MNQCDGCRRGLPVDERGNHRDPGNIGGGDAYMGCTRDRYDPWDYVEYLGSDEGQRDVERFFAAQAPRGSDGE